MSGRLGRASGSQLRRFACSCLKLASLNSAEHLVPPLFSVLVSPYWPCARRSRARRARWPPSRRGRAGPEAHASAAAAARRSRGRRAAATPSEQRGGASPFYARLLFCCFLRHETGNQLRCSLPCELWSERGFVGKERLKDVREQTRAKPFSLSARMHSFSIPFLCLFSRPSENALCLFSARSYKREAKLCNETRGRARTVSERPLGKPRRLATGFPKQSRRETPSERATVLRRERCFFFLLSLDFALTVLLSRHTQKSALNFLAHAHAQAPPSLLEKRGRRTARRKLLLRASEIVFIDSLEEEEKEKRRKSEQVSERERERGECESISLSLSFFQTSTTKKSSRPVPRHP